MINRGAARGLLSWSRANCGGLNSRSQPGFIILTTECLFLPSGATGCFPPDLAPGLIDLPRLTFFLSFRDRDRTSPSWWFSDVRSDCDLARPSCLLCPVGQWPYWSAGLCCGAFVPWDYWSQAEQQSMERLWEVQCCSVRYSRNVHFEAVGLIRQHVSEGIFICEQPAFVNILLAVSCVPKPLITIVAVSPSPPASDAFPSCTTPLWFILSLFICLATNLMSASRLPPPPLRLLLHSFCLSPSFPTLSLAFESASFVPDSHSSDWDILGFKVTRTDLLS